MHNPANGSASDRPIPDLTPRHREIVQLIARGYTNAQIAQQLVITPGTVANHIAAILQRLGASSRTDVAVWAVQHGLLGGDDRLLGALVQLLAAKPRRVDEALQQAAQIVADVLGAEKVDVWMAEPEHGLVVSHGVSPTPLGSKEKALGLDRLPVRDSGRVGWVLAQGEPFLTGRSDQDPLEQRRVVQELGVRSSALVPAAEVLPGRPGVLAAVATVPDRFSERDLVFLGGVAHWLSLIAQRAETA